MKKSDIINKLENLPNAADIVDIHPNVHNSPMIYFNCENDDSLHVLDSEEITDAEFHNLIKKYMRGEEFAHNTEALTTMLDMHYKILYLNYKNWKLRNKLESKQSNCDHECDECSLKLKYDIIQKNYDFITKENIKLNKLVNAGTEALDDSGMYF